MPCSLGLWASHLHPVPEQPFCILPAPAPAVYYKYLLQQENPEPKNLRHATEHFPAWAQLPVLLGLQERFLRPRDHGFRFYRFFGGGLGFLGFGVSGV